MLATTSTSTMMHCETWQEHDFGGPRYLDHGRHETRGAFERVVVRCGRCGREITQTRWTSLHSALRTVRSMD